MVADLCLWWFDSTHGAIFKNLLINLKTLFIMEAKKINIVNKREKINVTFYIDISTGVLLDVTENKDKNAKILYDDSLCLRSKKRGDIYYEFFFRNIDGVIDYTTVIDAKISQVVKNFHLYLKQLKRDFLVTISNL